MSPRAPSPSGTVGAGSLFALGVNGIVGVGIFLTPATIGALVPGPAGSLTYLVTACLLAPVAVTTSLLGRHLALNGGPYVWARAAFGSAAAWLVGWVAAISAVLSTAAVFSGVATQLAAGLGSSLGRMPIVLVCSGVLSLVVLFGLRPSAWVWNLLTAAKLVPLIVLLALVLPPVPELPLAPAERPDADWGRALLVALFPLQGFEIVPVLAGSVRSRNAVPLATLGALGFAALLYAAIQFVCAQALPELGRSPSPLAESARALGGPIPAWLVELGANVSALGVAFGMVVMTPRYLSALGEHAPSVAFLARTNAREVPHNALLLMLGSVIALAAIESQESLFVLSSSAVLVQYVAASASLLRLSLARQHGLTPLAVVPAVLTLGATVLLSLSIEQRELWTLGGLLAAGVLALFVSARRGR